MKIQLTCGVCKQTHKYGKHRMMHYAHDVDGDNVYCMCKTCIRPISCWREAAAAGWIKID